VGAEVRVTDGLNYYFEHRRRNPAQIADRILPTNDRVLGTDVRSGSFEPVFLRPDILLLANNPVQGNGGSYAEVDHSTPIYPVEFRTDVSGIDGTKADLRIRYGVNDRPDPSIRPWGAPPWQTPDIEVRNARNQADPAWFNVPWQANPNTVVGKVKNNGLLDAPGVLVNFYVKNYNVGGAPEIFLGSDTRDIPAGATVEFSTSWVPPSAGHFCIVVRIPLYIRPGTPMVPELTELNNVAQSNYDRFISPTASPAERRITSIEVGNPYDLPTRVYISAANTNPFYRTYLQHRWLDLPAGASRQVEVMMEYVGQLPEHERGRDGDELELRRLHSAPNHVSLRSLIVDPRDPQGHTMVQLGGAELEVVTGRGTRFETFGTDGGVVTGSVVTVDDRRPVPTGTVILTLVRGSQGKEEVVNQTVRLVEGRFAVPLAEQAERVRGYFVPPAGYGDATSQEIPVR
jgi:hypothetical protein